MSLHRFLQTDEEKTHQAHRLPFLELAHFWDLAGKTSSTLEKERLFVAQLHTWKKNYPLDDLLAVYQLTTKDFAHLEVDEETGVAIGLFLQALSTLTRLSPDELQFKNHGDWGTTVEQVWGPAKPRGEPITAQELLDLVKQLPSVVGKGSQKRKLSLLQRMLRRCGPVEARFFTRLVVGGSLKIGLQDKLVQRSYYSAFPEVASYQEVIERASNVRRLNFGVAVTWVFEGKAPKINALQMKPGHPVKPMLAERGTLDVLDGELYYVEEKYDGYRLQVHLEDGKGWLFSRQLTSQTEMLPDVLENLKNAFKGRSAIFDGELLAYDRSSGAVLPFQTIVRRRRKYNQEEIAAEMRTEYRAFDLLYLDGEDLTNLPLSERRSRLESCLGEEPNVATSTLVVTTDRTTVEAFVVTSKTKGHEGIMLKPANSLYLIGKRDKTWLKLKPQTFDMDGIVVGGKYGTGKRRGMISRIFIAFPTDPEANQYESLAVAVGSGMSEEQMLWFKDLLEEEGFQQTPENVQIDPSVAGEVDLWLDPDRRVVVEVVADSFSWRTDGNEPLSETNLPMVGGRPDLTQISLRFPRFKTMREEGKEPNSADSVATMVLQNLRGGVN